MENWWQSRKEIRRWEEFDDDDNYPVEEPSCIPKAKRSRDKKGYWDEILQEQIYPDPRESSWYLLYVKSDRFSTVKKSRKLFRRRFRLPRDEYVGIVNMAREEEWFPKEEKPDGTGRLGSPLELLVLGALRYLGRGWTFDDISESTNISEEKHRVFLHSFIDIGATIMFDKWVRQPTLMSDVKDTMYEFAEAGFDGAGFSTDATHVIMEKCSSKLRNAHLGGKMPFTARSFNISVNHRRQILAIAPGCPSRWNDKTISTPMKDSLYQCDIRLESMRKDVECTLGILKGRWRILKCGIRLQAIQDVDKVWKTCCALHNFLLNVDGLNEVWEGGIQCTEYEGELGLHDESDMHTLVRDNEVRVVNN